MIVKNEAAHLQKCLSSIRDIADQIVIVDTGSSDGTLQIAKSFDAEIEHFNWINNFSAARNKSLQKATADWILHLDADEVLDESSKPIIKRIIEFKEADAFRVSVRNYHPPGDMVAFQDSNQIRLFRNHPKYRFQNKIHEQIYPSLFKSNASIADSDILIHHFGYRENNKQKAQRNLPIILAALKENSADAYLQFKLGETYKALKQNRESKKAFLQASQNADHILDSQTLDNLYMRLAQLELEQNSYLESIRFAEKSLSFNPDNPVSLYVASVAALYLGEVNKAEHFLTHLNKINSQGIIPRDDVAQLLNACQQLSGGGSH